MRNLRFGRKIVLPSTIAIKHQVRMLMALEAKKTEDESKSWGISWTAKRRRSPRNAQRRHQCESGFQRESRFRSRLIRSGPSSRSYL